MRRKNRTPEGGEGWGEEAHFGSLGSGSWKASFRSCACIGTMNHFGPSFFSLSPSDGERVGVRGSFCSFCAFLWLSAADGSWRASTPSGAHCGTMNLPHHPAQRPLNQSPVRDDMMVAPGKRSAARGLAFPFADPLSSAGGRPLGQERGKGERRSRNSCNCLMINRSVFRFMESRLSLSRMHLGP
jgi:hypothetical protein